jgi:hypothetical protein
MKNYKVTFSRQFDVTIDAENLAAAEESAKRIVAQFGAETARLMSVAVMTEPAEAAPEAPAAAKKTNPRRTG